MGVLASSSHTAQAVPLQTLIVVGGPCGTGKTTVAMKLASTLDAYFLEGDDLHPPHNREKMARAIPLSESDRADWFANISEALESVSYSDLRMPVVLTCSSLKRSHRSLLRKMAWEAGMSAQFLFLAASRDELVRRVDGRKGHFMKSRMVDTQLETMEFPGSEERDACVVNVEGRSNEEVVDAGLEALAPWTCERGDFFCANRRHSLISILEY